jgi:hypothetical protein
MIVTKRTLAARVAFHEIPGLRASLLVLTVVLLGRPSGGARLVLPRDGTDRGGSRRWCRAHRGRDARHRTEDREAATRIGHMSDHTERIGKLRDRILAAKEFL